LALAASLTPAADALTITETLVLSLAKTSVADALTGNDSASITISTVPGADILTIVEAVLLALGLSPVERLTISDRGALGPNVFPVFAVVVSSRTGLFQVRCR